MNKRQFSLSHLLKEVAAIAAAMGLTRLVFTAMTEGSDPTIKDMMIVFIAVVGASTL